MSERGKYNNLLITISVFLNIVLTVMLIILVGQKADSKNAEAEADITGDGGQSEFEFVQYGDDIYVLNTDELSEDQYTGETLPTAQPTTATTTTTTTTATTTTTTASVTLQTLPTIPTQEPVASPTAAPAQPSPTQPVEEEDSGEWLDLW